jgi:hypothetical protein
MLRSLVDLEHYAIRATDGTIGKVNDIYFDDEAWMMRYLVVDTGTWLSSRKVLISPIAITEPDWTNKVLPVSLMKEQVRHSPDIDTRKPVSRQQESAYISYYGYPYYWERAGLWGGGPYPQLIAPALDRSDSSSLSPPTANARAREQPTHRDVHLRSGEAVLGYYIHATDGDIGHAQGLLIDEETWTVRFIFLKTSNWWFGHHVLVAPQWVERVSWEESALYVNVTREQVLGAPTYDPASDLRRAQEICIYDHYGRQGYWVSPASPRESAAGADSLPLPSALSSPSDRGSRDALGCILPVEFKPPRFLPRRAR